MDLVLPTRASDRRHAKVVTPGGVALELAHIRPDERMTGHSHTAPHLCFLLDGGFRERSGTDFAACGPLGLRLSPANDCHDLQFGPDGAKCLLVEIDGPAAPRPQSRTFHDNKRLARCAMALFDEFQRFEPDRVLRLDELALELFAGAERNARRRGAERPPDWLQKARNTLAASDIGGRWGRRALASQVGIHETHLSRAFRDHFGVTPARHRSRLRIERALAMMREGGESLAQIAIASGFSDQSHMTRAFRSLLGATPAQLRRDRKGSVELPG